MYKVMALLMLALALSGSATTQKEKYPETPSTDGTVLFANFNPGDSPLRDKGGWRIGGVNEDGAEALATLVTPSASGELKRIEVLLNREYGSGNAIGYLMTDKQGPGDVLASFLLSAPVSSKTEAAVVTAHLEVPCTISRDKRYWFMLEAIDPVNDSVFWPRRANQPETMIAIRHNKSQTWHMNGAYGAMLRMYSESIGAIDQAPSEPLAKQQTPSELAAKQQTPQDFLNAMVGQKLILLQFGDADRTKVKKNDLNKVKISCDLAVQVKEAHQERDKVIIAWEQIGRPALWLEKQPAHPCTSNILHDKGTLTVTDFTADETADSLATSLSKVLQTPEQYLATAGIVFNLPAEPDIQGPLPAAPPSSERPQPLLSFDAAFSEQARKSKYQGRLVVTFYVGTDGRAHRPSIQRPLGMGLDQQVLNVIPLMRFRPAHKLDQLFPAYLSTEFTFNIY